MPRGQSLWPLDRGRYPAVASTTSRRSVPSRLRPSAKEAKTAGRDAVGSPQEDETNVCSACPSGRPYRRAALSPWRMVSVADLRFLVTACLLQVLTAYYPFIWLLILLFFIEFHPLKGRVYRSRLWKGLSCLVDSWHAVDQLWDPEEAAQTGSCRHKNKEHDDSADGRPTVGKSLQKSLKDDDSLELSVDGCLPGGRNPGVPHSPSDVSPMSNAKKRHFVRRCHQRHLRSPGVLSKSNVSCRSSRSTMGATGSCTDQSLLTQENLTEAAGLEDARQILKLSEADDERNMVETADIENFTKAADVKIFSDALEMRNAASENSGLSKRSPENGNNPDVHVRPVKEINPPADFTENVSDANVPTEESNLLLTLVDGSVKGSAENQQENEISTTANCHVHTPKGLIRVNVNDKALDAQDAGPSEQNQVSAGVPHLLLSSDARRANSDADTKISMSHAAAKNGRTEGSKKATIYLEDMSVRESRAADDGQKEVSDVCLRRGGRASEAAVSHTEAESTDDVWKNEQSCSAVSKCRAGGKDQSGKGNGRQPTAKGSAQSRGQKGQGRASSSRSDGSSTAGSFGSSGSSGGDDDDKGKKDDNKNKDTGLMNVVRKKKKKKTKRQKSADGTKETGSTESMRSDIANDASAQMDDTDHRPSSTAPGPTDEQLSGDSTVNPADLTTATYSASDPDDGNDACSSTGRDVRALPRSSGNAAADASATYLSEGSALPDQPPEDPEQCVSWRPQVVDGMSPSDHDDQRRENAVVKLPEQCQEDLNRVPDHPCCWQPSSDSDESVNFCSSDEASCPQVTAEHSAEPVDITGANDVTREEVELKTPKQCTEDLARDISAHSTASPGVVQPHNATHGQRIWSSPMNIRNNVVLVDKCHHDWLRGVIRHLLGENRLLSRRRLCQKCRTNTFTLVLCPCGHLLCSPCGHNQMSCPVCRVTVELENKAAFF